MMGHGGEKYIRSAIGARLACGVGQSALSNFMIEALKEKSAIFQTKHSTDSNLSRLQRAITMQWRDAVSGDIKEHPLTEDKRFQALSDADKASLLADKGIKAYGTTFIAGIMTREFLLLSNLETEMLVLCLIMGMSCSRVNLLTHSFSLIERRRCATVMPIFSSVISI